MNRERSLTKPVVGRIERSRDSIHADPGRLDTGKQVGEVRVDLPVWLEALHIGSLDDEHDVGFVAVIMERSETPEMAAAAFRLPVRELGDAILDVCARLDFHVDRLIVGIGKEEIRSAAG